MENRQLDKEYAALIRFKNTCERNCLNRKVQLTDLAVGANFCKEFASILKVNGNIAQLNLSNNRLLNEGVMNLCEALETYPTIVHLDIGGNGVNQNGFKSFLNKITNNIFIQSLTVGNKGAGAVFKNQIGPASLPALVSLVSKNKVLQLLDLTNSYLGDNGLRKLSFGMKKGSNITCLYLAQNKITSVGVKHLANILVDCKICDLDFSCNPLGNAGIVYLKEPLSYQTSHIRNLNISSCGFMAHGAEEIFRSLTANRLNKLIMSKNDIGDDKITTGRMCETLWKNRTIQHLELEQCMMGDNAGMSIGEALMRGSALRYCSLKKNDISDDGAIRIA